MAYPIAPLDRGLALVQFAYMADLTTWLYFTLIISIATLFFA